jgi:hypothetical protein
LGSRSILQNISSDPILLSALKELGYRPYRSRYRDEIIGIKSIKDASRDASIILVDL